MIKKWLAAALSGGLFGFGLALSGMTQPAKVIDFLNVGGLWNSSRFGPWDASLAFVMGGAVCVTLPAFFITPRPGKKPWFTDAFHLRTRQDIDLKLVVGALLFGLGWGLVGYCPGPALASLLVGEKDVAVFVIAMLVGIYVAQRIL